MMQTELFSEFSQPKSTPPAQSGLMPIIDLRDDDDHPVIDHWLSRQPSLNAHRQAAVDQILDLVRQDGDRGLVQALALFYQQNVDQAPDLKYSPEMLREAHEKIEKNLLAAIREAIENVSIFHIKQMPESWFIEDDETGDRLGQRIIPIESAAILLSGTGDPVELLMYAVPAKLAGVPRIAVALPPQNKSGQALILAVLRELGYSEVYELQGAAAVGAFTYGTETIEPVVKIVGPGDEDARIARQRVSPQVGIDPALPDQEMVMLIDEQNDPDLVALDIAAFLESNNYPHLLVFTNSDTFAENVNESLQNLAAEKLSPFTKKIHEQMAIVMVHEVSQAVPWINEMAPQTVHIMAEDGEELAGKIRTAGTILIGEKSMYGLANTICGPSTIAPARRQSRFLSSVSVHDFIHRTNMIALTMPRVAEVIKPVLPLLQHQNRPLTIRSIQARLANPFADE